MKKRMIVIAILAICLAVAAYGTVAYFTHEETVTNVIVAGNIKVALHQWQLTDEGEREVFEGPLNVLPGTAVSKIVEVENTGNNPAWIRISVEKAIELAEGMSGAVDTSLISFAVDTEHWTERDGFYYYNLPLQAGETTAPLFTQVVFDGNMDNRYQNSTAVLTILVQATQVAHNGETVWDAAGWPEA